MRKVETTLYKFAELSEAAKKHVLQRERYINVEDNYWHEEMVKGLCAELEEAGYIGAELQFSGFSSQGDGASFTCTGVDFMKWTPQGYKLPKALHELVEAGTLSAKIERTRSLYVHEHTIGATVSHDDLDTKTDALIEPLLNALNEDARARCRAMYRRLEKEHDYQTEDAQVIDTLEANEYEFTAKGEQYRA